MDWAQFADVGLMETRLSGRKRRRRRPPSAPPIGHVSPDVIFRNFSSTCLAALVMLALLVTGEASSGCRVDHCTRQFQQSALASGVRRGSPAFCVILRQYSDCLRSTARSCRGHLAYHSTITLVQNWNGDANCSYIQSSKGRNHNSHDDYESPKMASTTSIPPPASNHHVLEPTARVFSSSRPDKPTVSSVTSAPPVAPASDDVCSYQSSRTDDTMLHCSFYGDPHLVTFHGEFQTCKVAGAWPLIDNAYLAVSVTNEAVVPGSAATATTKITIIIKGGSDCAPERTYEAAVDAVPASFVDGSQWGGPASIPAFQEASRPVRIVEKEPGRHVEIHARHLGAVLIIRQVGRYLTFAARLPRDIAEQGATREGLQLCVKGCPLSERIDVTSVVAGSAGRFHRQSSESSAGHRHHSVHSLGMHRDAALALCREYNLTDHYLDACMFDLMTTGDPSFSLAASRAQLDFHALLPDARLSNRTWPLTHSSPSSALQSSASSAIREAHGPGRPLALLLVLTVMSLINSPW